MNSPQALKHLLPVLPQPFLMLLSRVILNILILDFILRLISIGGYNFPMDLRQKRPFGHVTKVAFLSNEFLNLNLQVLRTRRAFGRYEEVDSF